jgi:hypothetical protein
VKLSDVLGNKKPEVVTTNPEVTKVIDEALADGSVIDAVAVIGLAERAIEAVDAEREAKARASLARRELEAAMDRAKMDSCEALGRTLKFKVTSTADASLKNIKSLIGEIEGKKLWDNLPRKPYRSLDIPKAADGGPEVE